MEAALARRIELAREVLATPGAVEEDFAPTFAKAVDEAVTGGAAAQNEMGFLLTCVDRTRISPELWRRLAECERELRAVLPPGFDLPDVVDPDVVFEPRHSARVLLVDADDRVLLFRGHAPETPDKPFWFTIGGGIDPGEDPRAAAARELVEETGLVVPAAELAGPVWRRREQFTFGGLPVDSVELFFVLRWGKPWEVDTSGFTELEVDTIEHHRWWSARELAATRDRVYPAQLRELLPDALRGGPLRTVH
ncbi:NUDIX hydrolase [Allokutzneria albata]|uniref:8-oxo-dGTP pyrophosphatase MutT, NUDIX family n=1 Tax=Allokutzneria albata TaxID=211114 RepID=A0A1H0DEU4_ALLAB|nr:NUDIX domain-containing protein [Allokutzneria albata]SDN68680.1 8-oxo-dGTP pyrophosphatase MutT, NUDIX family [Allokutzneria albata]